MTTDEEILAANAPYQPNRTTPFTVTPEGAKYGIIDINGTVGHIQQDKRTPEQQNALFQLYQSIAPAQIDVNDPIAVRNYNTNVYNKLHKAGKVDDFYRSKGLIVDNSPAPTTPQPAPAQKALEDAANTGKSFLQLYQDYMPKPEYEQERADKLQTNSKASIIADILKLVGEGITTKKGGTPIIRQSAVPMLNAELQKLNDTYKAEARAYKQGAFNALLMDEQQKKQEAIQKARTAAALAAKQMEIDAANEKAKEAANEKQKDREFTAKQKELDRQNATKNASIRSANSTKGEDKPVSFVDTDNTVRQIPQSEQRAWTNDLAKRIINDPNASRETKESVRAYPANAWTYWQDYLEFSNGKLKVKGSGGSTGATSGSRASRASQSNAPRSRASN